MSQRWNLAVLNEGRGGGAAETQRIEEPFGYRTTGGTGGSTTPSPEVREQTRGTLQRLKQKKAWEAARSPLTGFFMTALMLWMAGSSIHFFSIMIVVMTVFNAAKGLFAVGSVFRPFADLPWAGLLLQKLCYVALYALHLGAGVYKLHTLGLLPTTTSDWHSLLPLKASNELAIGGQMF